MLLIQPINYSYQIHQSKINKQYLPSKQLKADVFELSFTSSNKVQLEKSAQIYEEKIKALENTPAPNPNVAITSPDDIELLNKVFKKDGIGGFSCYSSCSLNSVLTYLAEKRQLKLSGNKQAFMIDRLSIASQVVVDEAVNKKGVKFYCYANTQEEADELIEKFNKMVAPKKIKVKVILKPKNQKPLNYPDSKTFKKVIKFMAWEKFPRNKKKQDEFIGIASRYFDDYLMVFSYALLCENLEKLYKKIEEEVESMGKTMDDVVYVVPTKVQSFSLITYLYAMQNDISPDKIKNLYTACESVKGGKVFVMLDDFCATGQTYDSKYSAVQLQRVDKSNQFIYATVVMSDYFKKRQEDKFQNAIIKNQRFVCAQDLKDLNMIEKKRAAALESPEKFMEYEDYISELESLSVEDLEYLQNNITNGFGGIGSSIAFPYMIPDNSSNLFALLGGCFLNNDSEKANKIISRMGINAYLARKNKFKVLNFLEDTMSLKFD